MSEQYAPVINKEEIAPGLVVYKDVIPGHHQLIPYIEQVVGAGMTSWISEDNEKNSISKMFFDYPSQFTDPNDFSITFEERISLVVAGFLGFVENDYVVSNNLGQKGHDRLVLTKYPSGISFLPLVPKNNNSIKVIYYLNEDFSGGNIDFFNLGINYEPKENQAIIFPQTEEFSYSVSEITDGVKYAIISYIRDH